MENNYIGIDLGGTRIKIGWVKDNTILHKKIFPADASKGLKGNLPAIRDQINSILLSAEVDSASLKGIGLGFPGLVDPATKKILSTNQKYDDALEINLEEWFHRHWKVPFFIDNDARMAAMGEWKSGAGRGTDNLVVMTIGTGIGTAAIIEGKLLRGKHFQAGCLGGHFSVNYHGRTCTCGNTGCVEAYASTWSIRERVMADPGFGESILSAAPFVDFQTIFDAARKADALAIQMKEDCIKAWGAAIVNLIHAYDPEVVVLGGGVLNNQEDLLPELTRIVHQHAWTPWGKVQVKPSTLLSDAGILGVGHILQHGI